MIIKHPDGKATFIFDQESESTVFLGGDFNSWNPASDPMDLVNGKWQITKDFNDGAYQFKYVIFGVEDTQWYNDWRADAYTKSPLGGENSVVIIEN